MRLIDGPDLTNIIAEKGPLSWDDTVDIVSQIASAIDFAHQQNVIHRDLKPGNIMVTGKQAVLTDFGLAQIVESNAQSISISGGFTGTYNYMPPEIFNNDTITSAVDIYALGCVLFEMVTGHMLFEGQSTGAIIGAHLKGVTLDQPLPEGTPPGLREVILTALAKDPFNRYATAGELVNELKRLSSDLLAKPYAALELAMSEERWEDALAITAEIRAQDPDYRDSAAIEERALAENEAAQRRQMAGQLETTALVALAAGNFDEVRGVLLQWRHVAPDDPQLGVIDGELQMAEQYAQVEEHIANEDWTKAELAAAVIISQNPDYRNIGSLKEKITTQLRPQPVKDARQSHPEEVGSRSDRNRKISR